jgi:hypothetical protein
VVAFWHIREFVAHYNLARRHRSIDLDALVPPDPMIDTSRVDEPVDTLGGLIQEYRRIA